MKKKLAITICIIASFMLGAFTALIIADWQVKQLIGQMMVTSSAGDILHSYAPLKMIDSGRQEKAVFVLEELLESALFTHEMQIEFLKADFEDPDLVMKARTLLSKRKKEDTEHNPGP